MQFAVIRDEIAAMSVGLVRNGHAVAASLVTFSFVAGADADRYEATLSIHPLATLARLGDSGSDEVASVPAGGLSGGLSWGLRNWLDVGADVTAVAITEAKYEMAVLPVSGSPQTGQLSRTTRLAQLRGGATFRLGVGWVPTVYVGFGFGARQRSAATLHVDASGGTDLSPDDEQGGLAFDVAVLARIGLDHRLNRRWSIGVAVGAAQCLGIGAPNLQLIDGSVNIAYSWYPLW